MAIKKSDLYSSLWASCDELRGGMDAENQQQQGRAKDQRALAEGKSDEGVEHGAGKGRVSSWKGLDV